MKRILLAPFLLATLFSFGSELKAHPARMDSVFEPTSKTPAQVRDDTKWLSLFNIIFLHSNGSVFSNNWTLPYKNQTSCIRNSNLLKSDIEAKFGSDIYMLAYSCVRVNK